MAINEFVEGVVQVQSTLAEFGYDLVQGVLDREQCDQVADEVARAFVDQSDGVIAGDSKRIVGGRNLQESWQGWRQICELKSIRTVLQDGLGDRFGLVRILFFDKPPGQSWNLALHRDQTIAVAEHHDPPTPYSKPTVKAGVPHVAADTILLEQMLTLRLHLDPMHSENGPLTIIPGSHRDREHSDRSSPSEIHCAAGDVFVMRPLLLHGSRVSTPECPDHRRVIHMEFSPQMGLQPPYHWYQFDQVGV